MIKLTLMTLMAIQYLNAPYIWGTNGPFNFDCSGLALKVLRDLNFELSDMTASDLYKWTLKNGFQSSEAGEDCLYFYGKNKITHVAIGVSDDVIVEAGGGGRDTTDLDKAEKKDARVRFKAFGHRKDLLHIVKIVY